jgi:hypothetical protein
VFTPRSLELTDVVVAVETMLRDLISATITMTPPPL